MNDVILYNIIKKSFKNSLKLGLIKKEITF